jgi:hypothetical protein
MDDRKTDFPLDGLPAGVPSEVRLLDHNWLTDQRAVGARLTLLGPHEAEKDADLTVTRSLLEAERAEADRLRKRVEELEGELRLAHEHDSENRSIEAAMRALQFESWELQNALDRAQRPLWKKLLRRS